MIKIARTAAVDEERGAESLPRLRTKISYAKENLNLFEDEIPENGRLEEMMEQTGAYRRRYRSDGETFDDGTNADDLPLNESDDADTPEEGE